MADDRRTADIKITAEDGIVRVVYRGKVEFDLTTEMLREVAGMAMKNNASSLLFDIRDADYTHYHVEAIEHTEQGPALGIERTFRIAFLGASGEEMLQFVENVTTNRGYQSKAFTDESEALAWLRSDVI